MGYMRHHAIVVTSWDADLLDAAHREACRLGLKDLTSNVVRGRTNGYGSFFIAPDGSKEGWDMSDEAEQQRGQFVHWVCEQGYEDGSSAIDYALVQFGDEDGDQRILMASRLPAATDR